MRKKPLWIVMLWGLSCLLLCGGNSWGSEPDSDKIAKIEKTTKTVRVGVYDNRAIAVAYAASKFNPIDAKMKEYKEAEAVDKKQGAKLKKELQKWAEEHQRLLHLQGFCSVPVDDLLSYVKDDLAKVAEKENVVLIVRRYDYASDEVEVVDVTDQIVALYNPSEKTLRTVDAIKRAPVLPIETVEKHGHDH